MYLKSIELSGFKSFAKKSVFDFNTPISAIVGPNGSGKSNIAEAFRFVLGEQSMKSMRGKRGEDLIWNGSGEVPRSGMAGVRVVFDNTRKVFELDFSEIIVERIVYRDGVNEYKVNGSVVRLKDILELLASAHIGATGHHIISQGEADKIIVASPKDRKSMVEDALGVKIYQSKLLEGKKKLSETADNIAQVEALRKEIAPHLRFLKRQVDKLEKTENLREELIALAKEYLREEEEKLKTDKNHLENEQAKLGPHLEVIRGDRDFLTRELGKTEGLISAYEKFQDKKEEKQIGLSEVEGLYQEVRILGEVSKILEKIRKFIEERRGESSGDEREKLSELKKHKEALEFSIKYQVLINEEKRVADLEREFRQELSELVRTVGQEVLEYRASSANTEKSGDKKKELERLKIRLEESSVAGSEETLKEYRETAERDSFLSQELMDLEKSTLSLEELISDLEKRLSVEFDSGLKNINKEFEKFFARIFGGGEAELILSKDADGEEGLDIRVFLPKKKVRSLMMLSGGERALTSIALIFAIAAVNPPPFIILDETDAALDEANSKKYGDLVEMLSEHSQLILITHNRETMSRAGVIYGVTMASNGISKVLSISFAEASEAVK